MKQIPKFKLTADHILYTIALANAVRIGWAYAFVDAGGNLLSAPGFSGALLGTALSVGTAFVAGKIAGRMSNLRRQLTWSAFALILALEPIILAPITVTHMPAALRKTIPDGWGWAWAIVVALLPSLVLAGVSLANGAMIESSGNSEQVSEQKPLRAKPSEEKSADLPAEQPAEQTEPIPASIPCAHAGAGCEVSFKVSDYKSLKAAQNAANAHAGRCQFKPTTVYAETEAK